VITTLLNHPTEDPPPARDSRSGSVVALAMTGLATLLWVIAVSSMIPPVAFLWWLVAPITAIVLVLMLALNAGTSGKGEPPNKRTARVSLGCLAALIVEGVVIALVPFGPYC
jgi:hypothetical protein